MNKTKIALAILKNKRAREIAFKALKNEKVRKVVTKQVARHGDEALALKTLENGLTRFPEGSTT